MHTIERPTGWYSRLSPLLTTILSTLTVLCILVHVLFLPACGLRGYPNSPEGVVRKMYDAIQERDQDKYIDCLAPESRMMPGFFFWEQLIRAGAGLFRVDASDLTKVTWKDLKFQTVDNDGTVAHVRVTGKLRLLSLGMEVPYETVETTKKVDGIWYVYLAQQLRGNSYEFPFTHQILAGFVPGPCGTEWPGISSPVCWL